MGQAMPLGPTLPLVLLVAAVALCAYTYLGYPAILELLRVIRRVPPHQPRRRATDWPTISVALPVYNEVEGIAGTLERILAIEYPAERAGDPFDFVVDGQRDADRGPVGCTEIGRA